MAAKVDLVRRREKPQSPGGAVGDGEGRLREIVLGGDAAHERLGRPFVEQAHGRGIAPERNAGEGVHDILSDLGFHVDDSTRTAAPTQNRAFADGGGVATPPRAENGLLRELVAEEDGGEAEGEAGGDVEREDAGAAVAEEREVFVHEGRERREAAAEAGGEEEPQARIEAGVPSGAPRHEPEQEAPRHVHGERRPRKAAAGGARQPFPDEEAQGAAKKAPGADGEEVEQRFHGFPTVGTTAKKTSGSAPSLTRVCSWPSGQKWQSPGESGSGTPSHVAVPRPERT